MSDGLEVFLGGVVMVLLVTLVIATALWARPLWLARNRMKPRPGKLKGARQ